MPDPDHVQRDAEIVAAIESFLGMARAGKLGYAAIVAVGEDNKARAWHGGSIWRMKQGCEALDWLSASMLANVENRTLPGGDFPADRVCYNIAAAPVSFDFFAWLVDAEMTRMKEGASAPLKVHFWFGRDGGIALTPPRRQFFDNVMRPAVRLIGAVETATPGGRFKDMFTYRDIMAMARAGVPVPKVRPTSHIRNSGFVTITLRESELWPQRNSDHAVWLPFAHWLERRGERVMFIRDTVKADEPLPDDFAHLREASFNLADRASIYSRAKLNYHVANGPFCLSLFMDQPWICFSETPREDDPYHPNRPSFWREFNGMEPGSQYPWATSDQRMIWEKPTLEMLKASWRDFQARCVAGISRDPAYCASSGAFRSPLGKT